MDSRRLQRRPRPLARAPRPRSFPHQLKKLQSQRRRALLQILSTFSSLSNKTSNLWGSRMRLSPFLPNNFPSRDLLVSPQVSFRNQLDFPSSSNSHNRSNRLRPVQVKVQILSDRSNSRHPSKPISRALVSAAILLNPSNHLPRRSNLYHKMVWQPSPLNNSNLCRQAQQIPSGCR